MSIDLAIFNLINGLFPTAAPLWTMLNAPLAAGALVVLALYVLWMSGQWKWAIPALFAVMISDGVSSWGLKPLVGRERPCATLEAVYVPMVDDKPHCGSGGAMPSSHAANSMALGAVLASPGIVVVSLIVGVARVAGGQHWPSDVVAGWALGLAIGWALRAGCERALGWR
jgi:membrane-associated phospholipid phosphatase